jgi:hypothetical protein
MKFQQVVFLSINNKYLHQRETYQYLVEAFLLFIRLSKITVFIIILKTKVKPPNIFHLYIHSLSVVEQQT